MSKTQEQPATANTLAKTDPARKGLALAAMADRIQVDPDKLMSTLKSTVFKGASNEELLALVAVSNEYNLNPLTKQIYAFPAKGGGIVPVVSIDGWVSMCNNHPQMDGMTFEDIHDGEGQLQAITCRIYRKDRSHPIEVTEYLSECKRSTEPWKMQHRMLRHKALMQCARYAFGFSGITDEDEAQDTPGMKNVTKRGEVTTKEAIQPFQDAEVEDITDVEDYDGPELIDGTQDALDDLTIWGDEDFDGKDEALAASKSDSETKGDLL